jgi:hypothetical protein
MKPKTDKLAATLRECAKWHDGKAQEASEMLSGMPRHWKTDIELYEANRRLHSRFARACRRAAGQNDKNLLGTIKQRISGWRNLAVHQRAAGCVTWSDCMLAMATELEAVTDGCGKAAKQNERTTKACQWSAIATVLTAAINLATVARVHIGHLAESDNREDWRGSDIDLELAIGKFDEANAPDVARCKGRRL